MVALHHQASFLNTQGAPLYYEVAGQGDAILFIHAGIADSRMWDEQWSIFAQHYQTIRYDIRGFGRSQIPAGPFAYHADPANLLCFLKIERAHVIGNSFGGKIAIDFALTYPELVTSLTLVAPSVSGTTPSPAIQQFAAEEEALLAKGDLEAATELNLRTWVDGPRRTPKQVSSMVRQRVYDMQYHAFTIPVPEGAEEIELQPPAISRLAELHMPTLIITGEYDLPDMLFIAQELAKQLPHAQQVALPDAAHVVSMEQPELFNQHALAFLQTH
ncbi:hydrolase [Reticulibacter mediterranei]|uniref:Hydrolase n=1 Tax=Reticulibacter mediterranei TaxID=2778369 RepID=A0A8J3IGT1_9CHLR|nr:alpha/beta hydrolase [Reticulibacter mediterranei]GHO90949.1 hydrolase [Reticulibacter mediterranei]